MNNILMLLAMIVMGLLCACIHKKKGYSFITGFFWGFIFFIIGLIVVLIENNKEEIETDETKLSLLEKITIFIGFGILFIMLLFIVMNVL